MFFSTSSAQLHTTTVGGLGKTYCIPLPFLPLFQCLECDASFKYRNHFKDHLRVHTDDTFQCPLCDYETKLQAPFTTHMTDRHGSGTYRCADHGTRGCSQVFQRLHDLARHLPKDHGIDTGFKLHHYDPEKGALKERLCEQAQMVPSDMLPKKPGVVRVAMGMSPAEAEMAATKPKATKKTGRPFMKSPGIISDLGGRPSSPGDAGTIRILATYPTPSSTPSIPVISAQFHEAQSASNYGPQIQVGGSFDLNDASTTAAANEELPVIKNIDMSDFQMTEFETHPQGGNGFPSPAQNSSPADMGFSIEPVVNQYPQEAPQGGFGHFPAEFGGLNSFQADSPAVAIDCQPVIMQDFDMVGVSLNDDYLDSTENARPQAETHTLNKKPEKSTGSKRGEVNLGKPLENMPSVEDSPSSRGRQRFQRKVYEAPAQETVKRIKTMAGQSTAAPPKSPVQFQPVKMEPVKMEPVKMEPVNPAFATTTNYVTKPHIGNNLHMFPNPVIPPAPIKIAPKPPQPKFYTTDACNVPNPYVKLKRLPPEFAALLLSKMARKKVTMLPKLLPKPGKKSLNSNFSSMDLQMGQSESSNLVPLMEEHRVTKTNVVFTPTGNNRCLDVEDPSNEWMSRYDMSCTACSIVNFDSEHAFERHQKSVHSNDRPWVCQSPGCTSTFGRMPHYREHIRGTHYPDVKTFKCIFCDYKCCTATQLTTHRAKNHSAFACPLCPNKFNSNRALHEHQLRKNHYAAGEKPPDGGFLAEFEGESSQSISMAPKQVANRGASSNRGRKSKSNTPQISDTVAPISSPVAFIVESYDVNIQAENDFQIMSPDFYDPPMQTIYGGPKRGRGRGRGSGGGGGHIGGHQAVHEAASAVKSIQDLNEEFEKCNDLLDDFF